MKQLFFLLITVTLFSCSRKVYTQEAIMNVKAGKVTFTQRGPKSLISDSLNGKKVFIITKQ